MTECIVRTATVLDIQKLLPLSAQFGYPTSLIACTRRFKEFTALDGYGIAVAYYGDSLVGWIAWSKSRLFISDKTRIHIEGLVVDENHRGKGIGKNLYFLWSKSLKIIALLL